MLLFQIKVLNVTHLVVAHSRSGLPRRRLRSSQGVPVTKITPKPYEYSALVHTEN
jgi:hypothetical protein